MTSAISSLSPSGPYGHNAGEMVYESGQSEDAKSPLSMSLGFLKSLTEKKTTGTNGQAPKKRGPKPDSKPALTRRQELNRQAQRTHRERKELYIKALEEEVLRLKEKFSNVTRDKDTLAQENRQLKELLAQHGIPWTGAGGTEDFINNPSVGYTSSGSISGSYAPGSSTYSPPPQSNGGGTHLSVSPPPMHGGQSMVPPKAHPGVDFDQAGIDFVLTLERPCMDHMQFLVERASEPDGEFCGHALMASCPLGSHLEHELLVPASTHVPTAPSGDAQKTWDLSKGDLANLLDLSKRLKLDGEITPVMAWGMLLGHPRFAELRVEDFETVSQELKTKIRCYGFGAVLEEFEVRDVLESVFYNRSDPMSLS